MANTVLALVGENANGILECQSQRFLALIESLGFQGRMLNVREPDFATRLHDVLDGGRAVRLELRRGGRQAVARRP